MHWFPDYNIILASNSPRRKQLLKEIGVNFSVIIIEVEEIYPNNLEIEKIPVFLAELKSKPFDKLKNKDLLISADTIVCQSGKVLGKPKNRTEARQMLLDLSGQEHQVITGVCLRSNSKKKTFSAITHVRFKRLTKHEIDYYISTYKPFDKAGSYGIQEWIGAIGIEHIEGSFYNVMGLPIQRLYEEIQKF